MPTDERILEALDTGLVLTPAVLAENIDKSREHVQRRCSELADQGYIDRVKRGHYQIADKGREFLHGDGD